MYLDENFDIYTIDESLFDLICRKFKLTGKQKQMNDESIDDMMQEWFLRKCRLGNTSFIKYQPSIMFRRVIYDTDVVSFTGEDSVEDDCVTYNHRAEYTVELNMLYDVIVEEFGQSLCNMFFDNVNGFTKKEVAEHYGISDSTVGRNIRRIKEWLKE